MKVLPFLTAATLACGAASASAQLRLPTLPSLPGVTGPTVTRSPSTLLSDGELAPRNLSDLRRRTVRELLRRNSSVLEADRAGEPLVRGEVLAFSPTPAALDALRAAGFSPLRERRLDGLDMRVLVLQAPPGLGTAAALDRAREIDPPGSYELNHVYSGSGTLTPAVGASSAAATAPPPAPTAPGRIGLIDGGIDDHHPVLHAARLQAHGCDARHPSAHGTAVASLMVGEGRGFRGAAPGATLYAADVFCDQPTGGAVDAVADALSWLAQERVPVINISLVGPANRVLERVIAAMRARGHVIVAAVGNDGPAAPPLYPAAYPGVVGVTAVDARRRVLPEAAQGSQVTFAAPGADMVAADGAGGFSLARGTSFAAPLVAGLLVQHVGALAPGNANAAVGALAAIGLDLGAPGRDPVFGLGLVGEELRASPMLARR